MRDPARARPIHAAVLAGALVLTAAPGCGSREGQASFDRAAESLRAAVAEVDPDRLEALADTFAILDGKGRRTATARYARGVALHASIWTPSFASPGLEEHEILARLGRSDEALKRAIDERAELVEARALLHFNRVLEAAYEDDQESRQRMQDRTARETLELVEAHPDHPGALAARAFAVLNSTPGAFREEGVTRLVRAREIIGEQAYRDLLETRIWSLLPLVLSIRTNLFYLSDFREARRAAETGARLEPPIPPLRAMAARLDHAVGHRPVDGNVLPAEGWRTLATDPEGDVRPGSPADGRALSYQLGDGGRTLWLKFQTHGPFPVEGFGVNLVIDDDGNQETGRAWWGSGSDFTFDRLVTVWVTRHGEDTYDGWVGVTDADAAMEQNMVSILAGGLRFSVLEDEDAVVVGVPRSALPRTDEIAVIGAVGSATSWSDDLPDGGAVTLSLER